MSELEDNLAWQMRALDLPLPTRELVFAKPRRWRFDFCWEDRKIALEVTGGSWINGGHNRGLHMESDALKYSEAAILGWRVLHVTTDMVKDGRALTLVLRALKVGEYDDSSQR